MGRRLASLASPAPDTRPRGAVPKAVTAAAARRRTAKPNVRPPQHPCASPYWTGQRCGAPHAGPTILISGEDSGRLSHVRGRTDGPPLLNTTIGRLVERQAAVLGDSDAVVSLHQNIKMPYSELLRNANEVARGLARLGVARHERVAIWAPNCAEWTVLQVATAQVRR